MSSGSVTESSIREALKCIFKKPINDQIIYLRALRLYKPEILEKMKVSKSEEVRTLTRTIFPYIQTEAHQKIRIELAEKATELVKSGEIEKFWRKFSD